MQPIALQARDKDVMENGMKKYIGGYLPRIGYD
jgi:hypothetical protein